MELEKNVKKIKRTDRITNDEVFSTGERRKSNFRLFKK